MRERRPACGLHGVSVGLFRRPALPRSQLREGLEVRNRLCEPMRPTLVGLGHCSTDDHDSRDVYRRLKVVAQLHVGPDLVDIDTDEERRPTKLTKSA